MVGDAQRMLELAGDGQPRPAIAFALELTKKGLPASRLIREVIGPVQAEVGRLWRAATWGMAQAHAATSVMDGVLGAVGLAMPAPSGERAAVLVACVEGEYHTMPARMGVELLRADGWAATFLGASLPAADLQRFAAREQPHAVVLSCTVARSLPGAARGIEAMAEIGQPTAVAGAGFGASPHRARRLGASAWIGAGADPTQVLDAALCPARPAPVRAVEAAQLELELDDLLEAGLAELLPRRSADDRAELEHILRYVILALDLDEPAVLEDFIGWLASAPHRPGFAVTTPVALEVLGNVLSGAGLAGAATACASAKGAAA